MSIETLSKDVAELKRRMDLAETKLAQHTGQFEFISGQLRDVQLFMHARFADVDKRFDELDVRFDKLEGRFDKLETNVDKLEGRFDRLEGKVDALPRIIAELIAKR